MNARQSKLTDFLNSTDWRDSSPSMLAGDASNRKYLRLAGGPAGRPVVLMDAAPELGEDVRPFVTVARHLRSLGLSAPEILAEDAENGFLILEDLGDALFARVVRSDPHLEQDLYSAATGVLVKLTQQPAPEFLTPYSTETTELATRAVDWYRLGADTKASPADRSDFVSAMQAALAAFAGNPEVLIQRDYHAENLIWLPDRKGLARVGLLDFQDARAGDPSYDLVSLLEDARRDVPREIVATMKSRFVLATETDPDMFDAAYATFGAQRNLRILGTFARLSLHIGKISYIDLIPRVWAHLQQDLAHPHLVDLRCVVEQVLPTPTPENLNRLKEKCATVLTP